MELAYGIRGFTKGVLGFFEPSNSAEGKPINEHRATREGQVSATEQVAKPLQMLGLPRVTLENNSRQEMIQRGNRGYGKMIADAALANKAPLPKMRNWLDDWIEPGPRRRRARASLSMFLKADLKDIPSDQVARYLEEMADDVRRLGSDEAVDRFIDKILPKILPNEPSER